jgi:lysozyme
MIQNNLVIDISHWNEVADWRAIKASGVIGVIHKFSQGTGYRDPMYDAAREGCRETGMLFGRYHFAEGSDVTSQIRNFLADLDDEDELLALDWEDNTNSSGTMSLSQAVSFVQEVERITGQCPVLYSGNTAKEALGTQPNPTLAKCRLWLAHYASQPVCPPGWDAPWLWQWTDKGKVPGIVGDVDQDAWQGSESALRAEWSGRARPPLLVSERPERPSRPERNPPAEAEDYDYVSMHVVGSIHAGMLTMRIPQGARMLISTTGDRRKIVVTE